MFHIEDFLDLKIVSLDRTSGEYVPLSNDMIKSFNEYIKLINNSNRFLTFFRGTDFSYLGYTNLSEKNFLKRIFVIGDKSKIYQYEHSDLNNEQLEQTLISKIPNFNLNLLHDKPMIRNLQLRAILHVKFNNSERNKDSLVSATWDFEIATDFALSGRNQAYVLVGFEDEKYMVKFEQLEKILGEEDIEVYGEEKEWMVDKIIFPSNIIGVIKVNSTMREDLALKRNLTLIINHNLIRKLEDKDFKNLLISIDQENFSK